MNEELEKFLIYLDREKKAQLNTIICYERELRQLLDYLRWKDIKLEDVEHKDIRDFLLIYQKKNLKKSTICRKIAVIKAFFNFCRKESWIKTNPARLIEFPNIEKPVPSFMTEEEVERFLPLPVIALRDYAILELLYATGVHVSDLTAISINDINLENRAIMIRGDRRRKREVFFGQKAARSLRYYLKARSLLIERGSKEKACFLNYKGERITSRSVERIVEKYWLLSGLAKKVTPRTFRHSFASHILGRGANPYLVQELLGHYWLISTEKYFRIDTEHLIKVHAKYHPRALEQPEKEVQTFEDVSSPNSYSDFIRY